MGPAIASLVQSPFAFPFGAANPQYAFQQQAAAFPQAGVFFMVLRHWWEEGGMNYHAWVNPW